MRSAFLGLTVAGILAAAFATRTARAADADSTPFQTAVMTQGADGDSAVGATPVRYGRGYYYGRPRYYGGPRYYNGRYGSGYRYDYRYTRPYRYYDYYDRYPYYGGNRGYGGAYFRGPGFSFGFGY
jgi:hypothetical protein